MSAEPRPTRWLEEPHGSAERRRWYAHTLIEQRLIAEGLPHEEAHCRTLLRQGIHLDDYAPVRLHERTWIAREWYRFTQRQRMFAGVREPLPPPPFPSPRVAPPVFCLRCGRPLRAAESHGRPVWVCDAGAMEYSIFATAEVNRLIGRGRRLGPPSVRSMGALGWYCPSCGILLTAPPLARDPRCCERCGFELSAALKENLVELNWHEA